MVVGDRDLSHFVALRNDNSAHQFKVFSSFKGLTCCSNTCSLVIHNFCG